MGKGKRNRERRASESNIKTFDQLIDYMKANPDLVMTSYKTKEEAFEVLDGVYEKTLEDGAVIKHQK